jgi:hypothetical protein
LNCCLVACWFVCVSCRADAYYGDGFTTIYMVELRLFDELQFFR